MKILTISFLVIFLWCTFGALADVTDIDNILKQGISDHVYPGIAAAAGDKTGTVIYQHAFGTHEYLNEHPDSPAVEIDSLFDLASVTKVFGTTSAVALLYQRGYIQLEDKIGSLLDDPRYSSNGNKQDVTVLNCLLHNAGYAPDPVPSYSDSSFGCPNNLELESMACLNQIYDSLLYENLTTAPGDNFVYSDLSFITLAYVVGSVSYHYRLLPTSALRQECVNQLHLQGFDFTLPSSKHEEVNRGLLYTCYFEAFVRKEVFQEDQLWLPSTAYLPSEAITAPHNRTIPAMAGSSIIRKGNVSDCNCFMMGGICGHAGIFTTVPDLQKFLTRLAVLSSSTSDDPVAPYPNWLNVTTVQLFSKENNASQSSRALGWTTNDPSVTDYGYSGSCGNFSTQTFMHIGYTGTCICIDPINALWSVVLTNRVYEGGSSDAVKKIYRNFNNGILDLLQTK